MDRPVSTGVRIRDLVVPFLKHRGTENHRAALGRNQRDGVALLIERSAKGWYTLGHGTRYVEKVVLADRRNF